ncbi:uncharacterized protein LOC135372624 [Ornithodoros turicata]|uniref:uncharacterized protein LOC135372624 n=1 Tax=Ornithodoros turicata TaxID=34597 RepID=UPI003138BFF6
MYYVLVHFVEENSFDVKSAKLVKEVKEDSSCVLTEGDTVHVEYSGKYYPGTLVSISANKDFLLDELEEKIRGSNGKAGREKTKGKKQASASQARQLLQDIGNANPSQSSPLEERNAQLKKEVSKLKRRVEALQDELEKHRELDNHLRKARKLINTLVSSERQTGSANSANVNTSEGLGEPRPWNTAASSLADISRSQGLHCDTENIPPPSTCRSGPPAVESGSGSNKGLLYNRDSEGVEELLKGSGVYVPIGTVHGASLARTSTSLARSLLRQVYEEQYMLACSVKGLPAKGVGKRDETRPGLNPKGLSAILEFTKQTAQARGLEYCEQKLIKSLGTLISEMRNK